MKLLTLFESTKKGKYQADQVYNLYMPNGGEDGVLVGWRGDWPEDHFIEFRGLPYSKWTHGGDDFQRVHDRLAGMRATVLHHNSVVNVLPNMPEHADIARAIDGGELPEWDKDRAFNEAQLYHATNDDIDTFDPLSHFGSSDAAEYRADMIDSHPNKNTRTYRANLDIKNPAMMWDTGGNHFTAAAIADGISYYIHKSGGEGAGNFTKDEIFDLTDKWAKEQSEEYEKVGFSNYDEYKLDAEHRKELIAFLKSRGHDGIAYKNRVEDAGSMSYLNFDPIVAEEHVYHSTTHDIDKFNPLSHFGDAKTAARRSVDTYRDSTPDAPRTYRAQLNFKKPIKMWDFGGSHRYAYHVAQGISYYYERKSGRSEQPEFDLKKLKDMIKRWKHESVRQNDAKHRKELISFLKSYGYDGIEYENQGEGEGATSYINLDSVVAESARDGVTIKYKGQPKIAVKPARAQKDILMMLPTAAMDAAFKGTMYVGPGGTGAAIGKRYEMFQQWIEEHDMYEVPEVYVHTDGVLSFTNGRHRYAVFRDAGVDPMPVAMSRSGVENAKKFLQGVIREADYSEGEKTFFHVSNDPLPNGTVLKPQGKEWTPADRILERYRPQGYLSRQEAVFLFSSMDDADYVGITGIHGHVEGYLYEVEPIGGAVGRSWHNVWWYDQIVRELRDAELNELDEIEAVELSGMLREYARRYWEGDDGPESGWEILVPAGKIVDYIGPAEDVLYEGMLTEMADPEMIRAAAPKALAMLKAQMPDMSFAHDAFTNETGMGRDDPKYAEKFAVWKEGYAQKRIGMAIGVLSKGVELRDGKLMVYRMLEVDVEEFLDNIASQGLGQYWSWSKDDAKAVSGYGGDEVLLTGAVESKHVDWATTIFMNAYRRNEMEITIPEGSPIKLLNIEVRGESIDPSLYGGRGRVLMSSIGESQIIELRDKTYQYIKSMLPKWPDYVLKDLVYPNVKRDADIKDSISEMLFRMGLSPDTKWQLIPDMQFTMDMWDAQTMRLFKDRADGDMGMQIPRDAERHDTQAKLAQQQGGVRDEPVIIVKGTKGYELIEGWHRTIQHFAKYPQGYTGPAWVAQS